MTSDGDGRKRQFEHVLAMLQGGFAAQIPTEDELRSQIAAMREISAVIGPDLVDEDFDDLFDRLSQVLSVRMELGTLVESATHRPWLKDRDLEWVHWAAYRQWLANEGRSPIVLDTLDQTLDTILDHMGDPEDLGSWERRGLVIGEVQSGKTGTYVGLIDKAIDAGYKVIVLLTGSTESLRQQTQSRIDQGVVGRDSLLAVHNEKQILKSSLTVGVGEFLASTSTLVSLTTMTSDFRKSSLQATNMVLGPEKVVIFVTKKNTRVLQSIYAWFNIQRGNSEKLSLPLLLIDDEADYASINTNREGEDPTATNAAIRGLLQLFRRNTYVGFTATPFANIFIDDEEDQDLFPRDFIYGLDSPTNYVGPQSLFSIDGNYPHSIVDIEDGETSFPLGHRSHLEVRILPQSLETSIRTFLLSNTLRDLRGEGDTPRSMLVNVSRFVHVQEQVFRLVRELVVNYKDSILLHSAAFARGIDNEVLRSMRETFDEHYGWCEFSWDQVLEALPRASREVKTIVANSKADKKLEQDELSREVPPRYIVVGGDLLSRGLTLDGLAVSYFYRQTMASDTLMQMGRWFGYRDAYADLFKVWMTPEMAGSYAHVALALDELKLELVRMRNQQLTPEQYGLAVRNHPDSLLITARNKMRSASPGTKQVSLRGRAIESHTLPKDRAILQGNVDALRNLVQSLVDDKGPALPHGSGGIWREVDKNRIATFLDDFRADPSALSAVFQVGALSGFVRNAVATDLQTWDVVVMAGRGSICKLPGLHSEYRQPTRQFGEGSILPVWLVSGKRMRVAGSGDVGTSLDAEVLKAIREEFLASSNGKKNVPDGNYIEMLDRPLLLLYPLEATKPEHDWHGTGPESMMVAVVIAIPGTQEKAGDDNVIYQLNTVAQRYWFPEVVASLDEDEWGEDAY